MRLRHLVVAGLLLAALVAGLWYLRRAQLAAYDAKLRADSLEVAHDSAISRAGFAERRSWQLGLERDSLEQALGRKPKVVTQLTVLIDTVELSDSGVAVVADSADSVRVGTATLYQEPVRAEIRAALPRPPALGRIDMRVGIDPITLGLRITCEEQPARDRARRAYATATGPSWAVLAIDSVAQSADVCNPKPAPFPALRLPAAVSIGAIALAFVVGAIAF